MKRIPFLALQEAIYNILKNNQHIPIYDYMPKGVTAPFIIFGAFTCNDISAKNTEISLTSIQLEIYSDYQGRSEINTIANNISTLLNAWPLNLSDGFAQYDKTVVTRFEAFPGAEYGYDGILTVEVKIINKGT